MAKRKKNHPKPIIRADIDIDKFGKRITVDPITDCWLWDMHLQNGSPNWWRTYGILHDKGISIKAHRASWVIFNGEIPDGLLVCHKCDVKRCCNPDHLFLGTQGDNMRDLAAKGLCSKRGGRKLTMGEWAERWGVTLEEWYEGFGLDIEVDAVRDNPGVKTLDAIMEGIRMLEGAK